MHFVVISFLLHGWIGWSPVVSLTDVVGELVEEIDISSEHFIRKFGRSICFTAYRKRDHFLIKQAIYSSKEANPSKEKEPLEKEEFETLEWEERRFRLWWSAEIGSYTMRFDPNSVVHPWASPVEFSGLSLGGRLGLRKGNVLFMAELSSALGEGDPSFAIQAGGVTLSGSLLLGFYVHSRWIMEIGPNVTTMLLSKASEMTMAVIFPLQFGLTYQYRLRSFCLGLRLATFTTLGVMGNGLVSGALLSLAFQSR